MGKERYTKEEKYEKICQLIQIARHLTACGYGNTKFVEEKEEKGGEKKC